MIYHVNNSIRVLHTLSYLQQHNTLGHNGGNLKVRHHDITSNLTQDLSLQGLDQKTSQSGRAANSWNSRSIPIPDYVKSPSVSQRGFEPITSHSRTFFILPTKQIRSMNYILYLRNAATSKILVEIIYQRK